jgi:hypothetical protein
MEKIVFILNTSAEMFITWLVAYTRSTQNGQFPTQRGYISLQQARFIRSNKSAFRLDIPGDYYRLNADGTTQIARHSESMIRFEVLSLDPHRIEVKLHYTQPAIRPYCSDLLVEISKRWTEACASVKEFLIESGADAILATLHESLANTRIEALSKSAKII